MFADSALPRFLIGTLFIVAGIAVGVLVGYLFTTLNGDKRGLSALRLAGFLRGRLASGKRLYANVDLHGPYFAMPAIPTYRCSHMRRSGRMRNDMATITALLFDLDETLVADEASTEEALRTTCLLAQQRHGLDPQVLTCAVRQQARSLWQAAPTIGYCRAVGISSVEGLRARFLGDDPGLASLRAWAATYRYAAWSSALAVLGVQDGPLAEGLAARFVEERGARHTVFADVVPALTILKRTYALAIVTNGSPELQRAKIRGAHLVDLAV